jgi:hypothetical protein
VLTVAGIAIASVAFLLEIIFTSVDAGSMCDGNPWSLFVIGTYVALGGVAVGFALLMIRVAMSALAERPGRHLLAIALIVLGLLVVSPLVGLVGAFIGVEISPVWPYALGLALIAGVIVVIVRALRRA